MIGHRRDRCDRRRLVATFYAALIIVGICSARAGESPTSTTAAPIAFSIPAQPLAGALQAFGQAAGVQVLYESASAAGRQSVAVQGEFTPEAALNLLLAGTELRVRYITADAMTIAPPSANGDLPPSMPLGSADLSLGTLRAHASIGGNDLTRLHDYSEAVQMDIQRALRRDRVTRAGSYRAILDLWVDPSRTVQRTELVQTTGDLDRDTAVISAIRGLTISQPTPANTPQPVRVVIVVKPIQ